MRIEMNTCYLPSAILVFIMVLCYSTNIKAGVRITYGHDKTLDYQVKSMEIGHWNFHPGWYYALIHKKYSGSNGNPINPHFNQLKSSSGWVSVSRGAELAEELNTKNNVQNQLDEIQPIVKEETLRMAERTVDLVYPMYKSKFKHLINSIDNLLTQTLEKGQIQLVSTVVKFTEEKELLQEEIKYIHKQGPTKQIEQGKREIAYEEVWKKLQNLHGKAYKLLFYSQTLYDLKY